MVEVVENPIIVYEKGIYRPEPTRFWILEKELRGKISKLESEGWIKKLSEELSEDEETFSFFVALHEKEIDARKRILKELYPDILMGSRKWDRVCRGLLMNPDIGIGGIRNFRTKPLKVRCLHLWTAYHLGDREFQNPIGEFVLSRI